MNKNFILIVGDTNSHDIQSIKHIIDTNLSSSISYLESDQCDAIVNMLEQHQPDCLVVAADSFEAIKTKLTDIDPKSMIIPPMVMLYHDELASVALSEDFHVQYLSILEVQKFPVILSQTITNMSKIFQRTLLLEHNNQQFHKEIILHEEANHYLKLSHQKLQEAHEEICNLLNILLVYKLFIRLLFMMKPANIKPFFWQR